MDPETIDQLTNRFRAYLEAQPEDAARSAGAEDAAEVDLYTLFTELAALKNEVRLESRQVKEALDRFRQLLDSVGESNRQLSLELERRREETRTTRRDTERPLLLEILDLRDRLAAGVAAVRDYHPSLFLRLKGGPERLADELTKGMAITLRRVDEVLARYHVEPVTTLGRPLDPHLMRATGVEIQTGKAPGVVLAEVRKGFSRREEVLRLAEVIVNKNGAEHD